MVLGVLLGAALSLFLGVIPEKSWLKLVWILWFGATFFLVSYSWKSWFRPNAPESPSQVEEVGPSAGRAVVFEEKPAFDGLIVKQRVSVSENPRADEIEIEVFEHGKKVATARAINIDNECSWAWASADEFVERNNEICDLQGRLSNPVFTERFERSFNLVFVGLDSYAGKSQRNDSTLSDDRARTLALTAVSSYPALQQGMKRGWVVGLGRSTVPARKGSLQELRQRAAVVIGVATEEDWPATKRIILAVLNRVEIGGVDLSKYDRAASASSLAAIDLSTIAISAE